MQTGDPSFAHERIEIRPGRVDTLTPGIFKLVEHIVQDLDPEVRHADLIDIGKTHCKSDRNVHFIFRHAVHFVSDIACRFFDFQQDLVT